MSFFSCTRNRWWISAGCVALATCLSLFIHKITLSVSVTDLLPPTHPDTIRYNHWSDYFKMRDSLIVATQVPHTAAGISTLKQVSDALWSAGCVGSVEDVTTLAEPELTDTLFQPLKLVTFSMPPEKFFPALRARAEEPLLRPFLCQGKKMSCIVTSASLQPNADERSCLRTIHSKLDSFLPINSYYLHGPLGVKDALFTAIEKDQVLTAVTIFIVTASVFFYFLSLRVTLSIILGLIVTNGIIAGLMGLLKIPIDGVTNIVFSIIVASCVEDGIYLFSVFKTVGSLDKAITRLSAPSFLTSLTTIIGFGSLGIAESPSIKHFGAMAALGALVEYFVSLTLTPQLFVVFSHIKALLLRKPYTLSFGRSNRLLASMSKLIARRANRFLILLPSRFPRTLFATAAILSLAVVGVHQLKINDDWIESLIPESSLSKANKNMLRDFGYKGLVQVIVKDPNFSKVTNWNDIRTHLSQISGVSGALSEHDLTTWSLARLPAEKKEHYKALASTYLLNRSFHVAGVSRFALFLNRTDSLSVERIAKDVHATLGHFGFESELTGFLWFQSRVGNIMNSALTESLIVSLVLVGIVIIFALRPWRRRLQGIIVTLWPPLVFLGLFGISGHPFALAGSVFASLIIGLAGDNVLQIHAASLEASAVSQRTKILRSLLPAARVNVLMCISMSSLALAQFRPVRDFCIYAISAFALMLIADVMLFPALMLHSKKKNTP